MMDKVYKDLLSRAGRQHVFPNDIIHIRKSFLDEMSAAISNLDAEVKRVEAREESDYYDREYN